MMMVDVKCGMSGCDTQGEENMACFPIPLDSDDPDFKKECLQFVRTLEVPRDDGTENCKMCKYQKFSTQYDKEGVTRMWNMEYCG